MKKLSLIALAAMTMLPGAMNAIERTDTVTNKKEFTDAINAANAAQAGDVFKIVCKWDASNVLNIGNVKPTMSAGKLIITSDETEYDKMPQMLIGFDWAGDLKDDGNFALVFENVGLQYRSGKEATSGQIVYFNKRHAQMDSLIVRNCDISNYPRTFYRAVPKDNVIKSIGKIEMSNCRVHDCNISSGNNWACIYPGQAVNEVIIRNNMFYDMPYCQAIFQMGYASEGTGTTPTLYFENNTVLQGKAAGNRFQVINTGKYFGIASTFNINNNIFLAPQEGTYADILKNGVTTVDEVEVTGYTGDANILNASGALVYASNNVIDPVSYKTFEASAPEDGSEDMWLDTKFENGFTPEEAGFTSWAEGVVFQDAASSFYYMLKSSKPYTMGVNGTYLGSANTYVDKFPVKADVNIAINGPKYVTYTITPEKAVYYADDEITITLKDHNSFYRTFNTFKGWSDGNNELTRTVKLTGDLDLTATFENDNKVVAAFDFSKVTGGSFGSYDSDIYFDMNDTYKAVVKAVVCDTATTKTAPFPMIPGNFQGRAAKFGEDAVALQMPIISRRTSKFAKNDARDYAVVEFSTKDVKTVEFSCFVGTDNNAAKVQALDYSLDGESWTRFSEVEIENGKWAELKGQLPAELENKEKVYVRITGDLKNGYIITPDPSGGLVDENGTPIEGAYENADAFEYIGNILISGDTSNVESGIINVNSDNKTFNENAPVYNMMGMKVAKGTKGLLIQNGKKIIVR